MAFDLEAGGVLCAEHRRGVAISPEALDLLRRILGGQLGAALNEPESPPPVEVDHLATRAVEHHLERRLALGHACSTGPDLRHLPGGRLPTEGQEIGPHCWVAWSNCIQRWPTWSHWM